MLRQRRQAVLEIGLRERLAVPPPGGLAQRRVTLGEQPGHRDEVLIFRLAGGAFVKLFGGPEPRFVKLRGFCWEGYRKKEERVGDVRLNGGYCSGSVAWRLLLAVVRRGWGHRVERATENAGKGVCSRGAGWGRGVAEAS